MANAAFDRTAGQKLQRLWKVPGEVGCIKVFQSAAESFPREGNLIAKGEPRTPLVRNLRLSGCRPSAAVQA